MSLKFLQNFLESKVRQRKYKGTRKKKKLRPLIKKNGSGLGLSIVNKIINDHNGSIKFLNHDKGAKIEIILPTNYEG